MHMIDVLLPLKRLSLFLQQECSLAAEVHASNARHFDCT